MLAPPEITPAPAPDACDEPAAAPPAANAHADQRAQQERRFGIGDDLFHPRDVVVGDVAGFVGKHPDQLVRRLRGDDGAGIDEQPVARRDKGIESLAVDQLDRGHLLARRLDDRPQVVGDQRLGLGVAHRGDPVVREGGRAGQRERQRQGAGDQPGRHFPRRSLPARDRHLPHRPCGPPCRLVFRPIRAT